MILLLISPKFASHHYHWLVLKHIPLAKGSGLFFTKFKAIRGYPYDTHMSDPCDGVKTGSGNQAPGHLVQGMCSRRCINIAHGVAD